MAPTSTLVNSPKVTILLRGTLMQRLMSSPDRLILLLYVLSGLVSDLANPSDVP